MVRLSRRQRGGEDSEELSSAQSEFDTAKKNLIEALKNEITNNENNSIKIALTTRLEDLGVPSENPEPEPPIDPEPEPPNDPEVDQAGGRRRRKSRKSRKFRRPRKSRRSRRSRRH